MDTQIEKQKQLEQIAIQNAINKTKEITDKIFKN